MTAGESFSLLRGLRRRLFQFRAWFRSRAIERELGEELPGASDAALEAAREAHTGRWFAAVRLDARHGVRQLRRSPGFAAVAILTLALGIGANLALLSLAAAVLRLPAAFPHPEQLALVTGDFAGLGIHGVPLSVPELYDVRDGGGVGQVAGTWEINNNLAGGLAPRRIDCLGVSLDYFAMLGVKAELGRMPQAGDDRDAAAHGVVVISDALWRGAFGASPAILGRRLQLDGDGYTVVGVVAPGFVPPGVPPGDLISVWIPLNWRGTPFPESPDRRVRLFQTVIVRLRPGEGVAQAQARLAVLSAYERQHYPTVYHASDTWTLRISPLNAAARRAWSTPLLLLLGAAGFVLLLAVFNIANLNIARMGSRRPEIAIRRALGASRRRLAGQCLVEAALLAVPAAALGWLLASALVPALAAWSPLPLFQPPRFGWLELVAAAALTLALALGCGLAPLTAVSTTPRRNQATSRLRAALVAAELALAMMLAVGAGLLAASLTRVLHVPSGIEPAQVLTFRLWLPIPNDAARGPYFTDASRQRFYRELLDRLAAIPGVRAVGGTTLLPLSGARGYVRILFPDRRGEAARSGMAEIDSASAGYFAAMGVHLREGRPFNDAQPAGGSSEVVVSAAFARRYLPGEALGQTFQLHNLGRPDQACLVVGVAQDVRFDALDLASRPEIYLSQLRAPGHDWTVAVRSDLTPAQLMPQLRATVATFDPELPLFSVRPMTAVVAQSLARRRYVTLLVAAFGFLAAGLAALGVYGVMAYLAELRRREFAIRLALGARLRRVVGEAMTGEIRWALTGVGLGAIGAALASGALASLLFATPRLEPGIYAAAGLLLLLLAAAGSALPAWRTAHRLGPGALRD